MRDSLNHTEKLTTKFHGFISVSQSRTHSTPPPENIMLPILIKINLKWPKVVLDLSFSREEIIPISTASAFHLDRVLYNILVL